MTSRRDGIGKLTELERVGNLPQAGGRTLSRHPKRSQAMNANAAMGIYKANQDRADRERQELINSLKAKERMENFEAFMAGLGIAACALAVIFIIIPACITIWRLP